MKRLLFRLLLAAISTALFFVLAELLYRALGPEEITTANLHAKYRLYYQDAERNEIDFARARERGLVELEATEPRPRNVWAPNITFHLCYTGARQPYFDEQGCVPCVINSRRIREREELCEPKPAGQRRVVCIGDSFTFGWGVRVEDAWPRRVETVLRERDDAVRTVNCGASGAIYADEYALALRERFHLFEPDVVVVTLCLNDLIPSTTALSHQEGLPWLLRQSRVLRDLFQGYALERQLWIDPRRDLVQELLDLPEEFYQFIPWLGSDKGLLVRRAELWPGGGPQRALLDMQTWCNERGVRFGVVVWPYFQGLGPGEHYPFRKIHELVAAFCEQHGIAFLDVLPELAGKHRTPDYWVNPADYHGNHVAHAEATPAIAAFVQGLLDRR